jgi:hypothetical protein
MINSNVDLTSEILALVAKAYPNGTTLTVHNGQVEVKLPNISEATIKVKKVLPNIKAKPIPEVSPTKLSTIVIGQIPMYLTDAEVHWEVDNQTSDISFFVSSEEHGLDSVTLDVQDEYLDYFNGMLRPDGQDTDDLGFEVQVHYEDGNIISAEYVY